MTRNKKSPQQSLLERLVREQRRVISKPDKGSVKERPDSQNAPLRLDLWKDKLVQRIPDRKEQRKNPHQEQDNHGRRQEIPRAGGIGFLFFSRFHPAESLEVRVAITRLAKRFSGSCEQLEHDDFKNHEHRKLVQASHG